jgi:hypothetical protein
MENKHHILFRRTSGSLALMLSSLPFLSQQEEGGWRHKCILLPTPKEKDYGEGVGWMLQFFEEIKMTGDTFLLYTRHPSKKKKKELLALGFFLIRRIC